MVSLKQEPLVSDMCYIELLILDTKANLLHLPGMEEWRDTLDQLCPPAADQTRCPAQSCHHPTIRDIYVYLSPPRPCHEVGEYQKETPETGAKDSQIQS